MFRNVFYLEIKIMSKKIIVAILLFLIGVINIADWILFSTSNEDLTFSDLLKKYADRLPFFLQSFT